MFRFLKLSSVSSAAWILTLFAGTSAANAQYVPTATRTYSINVFAAGTRLDTDYNTVAHGVTFGVDATRRFHFFDASVEARYTYANSVPIGEDTLSGGIKFEHPINRFHPYADFLIGHGVIHFNYPGNPTYAQDDSIAYTFGGGLDYDVTRNFAIKGEFQESSWKLGSASHRLTPQAISIGVVYRIPFRRLGAR